jgi:TonB family protein
MHLRTIALSGCGAILGMVLAASRPSMAGAAEAAGAPDGGREAVATAAAASFEFDIPAQPLESALDRFAAISGRSALFSSAMVAGLTAAPVHGPYTPMEALHHMLEGTGLDVEEVISGHVAALILRPVAAPPPASAAPQATVEERLQAYDSLLQTRIWASLCADPRTAESDYRSLLRFSVSPSGRIERVRLLGTSGDAHRDAALLDIAQHVQLEPPPAELPQPVTLLILPRQAGGPGCPKERGRP